MLHRDFGELLSANLGVAYLAIFIAFALLEAVAGQPQQAAASPRRALVNFGMLALTLALAALMPFSVISAAQFAGRAQLGLFNHIAAPAAPVLLVALLTRTGLNYALHRLSHRIPLLWRLHRCHHSDPHVDLSLTLRHHPLELLPGLLVFPLGVVAMGLPLWAVATVELLMIVGSFCEHVAIRLPPRNGRWLDALFVTPAVHHIHHSAHPAETDSNFGSLFTLWDRLFGTFRAPETTPVARIGLGDADDRLADNFLAQLMLPFAATARVRGADHPG